MNTGKPLFAQIMELIPAVDDFRPVRRALRRRQGRSHADVRGTVSGHGLPQPTYRESLRDIEACLSAQGAK